MAKAPKKARPEREDFATTVANRFIAALETGTAPWQKPWAPGELTAHYNPTTGNPYRGFNQQWLTFQGYADPRWMTYKQAEAMGAQVRKGENGTTVEYWQWHSDRPLKDDQGRPVTDADGRQLTQRVELESPRRFYARVFNAEQIDGLPALPPREVASEWERHARAEAILAASEAPIRHANGDRAYYSPGRDHIVLPEREQFPSAENYYSTALHELGHSTGHPSRLDRDLAHPFGSEGYAKEELVAELYSFMMAQRIGIEFDPANHESYVSSWIKALQNDPREIFRAAAAAEKAMEYVLERERQHEQTLQAEHARWLPADVTVSQFRAETAALGLTDPDQAALLLFGRDIANALNVGIPHDLPAAPELTTPFEDLMSFAQRGDAQMLAASHVLNLAMSKNPEQAALLRPKWALAAALVEDRINDIRLDLAEAELREQAREQENAGHPNDYAERAQSLRDDATIDEDQAQSILDREFPMSNDDTDKRLAAERVNLAVPFSAKNAAKAAGAKWDKEGKVWYAPEGADLAKLERWIAQPESQAYVKPPREELADAMIAMGLLVTEEPKLDGKWHRVPTTDDKPSGTGKYHEKSGAYRAYDDRDKGGLPAGTIQNHKTGEVITWKYSQVVRAVAPEVRAQQEAEKAERNAAREAAELVARQHVAELVGQLLDQGQPVPADHLYLTRKDIAPQGLVMMDGVVDFPPGSADPQKFGGKDHLLIPAHDMDGKVWAVQSISPHGKKSFPRGATKADMHHLIGEDDGRRPMLLTEGYATGRDLHEGTTYPVAVCFDAGNLERVAALYRERYPDRLLVIAGDNDHRKEQEIDERTQQPKVNVGKTKALQTADAIGGYALLPAFAAEDKGSDWNDLRKLKGRDEQLDQLREGMRAAIRRHQAGELTRTGEGEKLRQDRDERQLERELDKARGREDGREQTRSLDRDDREQERGPALAMSR